MSVTFLGQNSNSPVCPFIPLFSMINGHDGYANLSPAIPARASRNLCDDNQDSDNKAADRPPHRLEAAARILGVVVVVARNKPAVAVRNKQVGVGNMPAQERRC